MLRHLWNGAVLRFFYYPKFCSAVLTCFLLSELGMDLVLCIIVFLAKFSHAFHM